MTTRVTNRQLKLDAISGNTSKASKAISSVAQHAQAGRKRHVGVLVGRDWKIDGDGGLNLIVFKKVGKSWRPDIYVSRLDQALRYLLDQKVRQSDLGELHGLVDKIEELKREIVGVACVGQDGDQTKVR